MTKRLETKTKFPLTNIALTFMSLVALMVPLSNLYAVDPITSPIPQVTPVQEVKTLKQEVKQDKQKLQEDKRALRKAKKALRHERHEKNESLSPAPSPSINQ